MSSSSGISSSTMLSTTLSDANELYASVTTVSLRND
eukprot:CAMPEP_0175992254 /NCGR_PEP_ID=MMETSP0108-20121206/53302_1 /TAXON_ID=195067 ORGANISM="Goniomonas pacifica, Strain CCMP1869" /NCGR_SAMPLE_ID=MMETSP0108 /ASSEMBLY_ACC=CAM_ASM_000204 /LENGTH=35 /DNA_ID= /DNA_START= /DNA_END= /DNA_ORIENTATION=